MRHSGTGSDDDRRAIGDGCAYHGCHRPRDSHALRHARRGRCLADASDTLSVHGVDAQFDLFGGALAADRDPVGSAVHSDELKALGATLPDNLRFGTSSWSFPGWTGSVYARRVSDTMLARAGLPAYARHPLFRAVSIDRTFYGPIAASEYAKYADGVPEDFRFLVKAPSVLTMPTDMAGLQRRADAATRGEHFLDSAHAIETVVAPALQGLGNRLGSILFQFPPLPARHVREPARWLEQLAVFLEHLPKGPQYSVELRNRELLTREYGEVLSAAGVTHCYTVHPRMPDVLVQASVLGASAHASGTQVLRWMLHPSQVYETARERYFPFDRVVDPDPPSRTAIAEWLKTVVPAGREVIVIANNKAEGSAPLSLTALAREYRRDQALNVGQDAGS